MPQRPALWAAPKIVFPDISDTPRFALDASGVVVNGNCYWISLADVGDEDIAYLMLAVANSSLGVRYYVRYVGIDCIQGSAGGSPNTLTGCLCPTPTWMRHVR